MNTPRIKVLLCFFLVVALTIGFHVPSRAIELEQQEAILPYDNIVVGDILAFGGHYWRVLDEQYNKVLLLSETILYQRRFHDSKVAITWEHSELRNYLNDTFYYRFASEDRDRILEVNVITNDNQWFGTNAGNDTVDKIFLLSLEEVVQYFGDSGQLDNRPEDKPFTINDQYNALRAAFNQDNVLRGLWWLRSPGRDVYNAAFVWNSTSSGALQGHISITGGVSVNSVDLESNITRSQGVRPALWLYINTPVDDLVDIVAENDCMENYDLVVYVASSAIGTMVANDYMENYNPVDYDASLTISTIMINDYLESYDIYLWVGLSNFKNVSVLVVIILLLLLLFFAVLIFRIKINPYLNIVADDIIKRHLFVYDKVATSTSTGSSVYEMVAEIQDEIKRVKSCISNLHRIIKKYPPKRKESIIGLKSHARKTNKTINVEIKTLVDMLNRRLEMKKVLIVEPEKYISEYHDECIDKARSINEALKKLLVGINGTNANLLRGESIDADQLDTLAEPFKHFNKQWDDVRKNYNELNKNIEDEYSHVNTSPVENPERHE